MLLDVYAILFVWFDVYMKLVVCVALAMWLEISNTDDVAGCLCGFFASFFLLY